MCTFTERRGSFSPILDLVGFIRVLRNALSLLSTRFATHLFFRLLSKCSVLIGLIIKNIQLIFF